MANHSLLAKLGQSDNPLFSGVLLADGLLYGYDVAPNPSLPPQLAESELPTKPKGMHRPPGGGVAQNRYGCDAS